MIELLALPAIVISTILLLAWYIVYKLWVQGGRESLRAYAKACEEPEENDV